MGPDQTFGQAKSSVYSGTAFHNAKNNQVKLMQDKLSVQESLEFNTLVQQTFKRNEDGQTVQKVIKNGKEYIKKTKNTWEEVQKFLKFNKYQVGVKIEEYKKDEDGFYTIYMQCLIPLQNALQAGAISKNDCIQQLRNIHQMLIKKKTAHCDIKLDNIGFDIYERKVILIDNNDCGKFGQQRCVYTPGENMSNSDIKLFEQGKIIIDNMTDEYGFNNVIKQIQHMNTPSMIN